MASSSESAIKTYRYLRLAVVGLAVLLGISVAVEWLTGQRGLGSISAYYYTPVRSIFVGALMGMGLALIAIKGREDNYEDILLNIAGMLAPVVALVPTPLRDGQVVNGSRVDCPGEAERCVPPDFVAGVDNNVVALAIVAGLGLGLTVWMVRRAGPVPVQSRVGLAVGIALLVAFLGLFVWPGEVFMVWAHYASAVPMFAALVAVVAINARDSRAEITVQTREISYRPIYGLLWSAMTLVLVGAAGYGLFVYFTDASQWVGWLFVLEAVLLTLFAIFWIFQTLEHYDDGVPAEPTPQPTSVETSLSS